MKLLVEGLNSYYGPAHILFDIALEVGQGEVVALLGPLTLCSGLGREGEGFKLALRALGRPPVRHPALERAQKPIGVAPRMVPLQLFQQRRRAQARNCLQHRDQLLPPDLGERILARAIAPCPIALAGQHRICPDPASSALAKPGTGRRSRLGVALFA